MRTDDWLSTHSALLQAAGIDTARLDCLVLLEDAVEKDRSWLLAHPEYQLPDSIITKLHTKITRRSDHVPLAYIRGKVEFYGRMFAVDEHVLVPRSESEVMLEILKSLPLPEQPTVVDVGTGSGALAISAQLELPQATVIGLDIDDACLKVAIHNAKVLQAKVTFNQANLLALHEDTANIQFADCILANLPYVPTIYPINQAAQHEPALALFGGDDGLDLYRVMFGQLDTLHTKPDFLVTETLPSQHVSLADIAKTHGYAPWVEQAYIQAFRRLSSPQ